MGLSEYRELLAASEVMRKAAQGMEWEHLADLVAARALLVNRLPARVAAQEKDEVAQLIREIQEVDQDTMALIETWRRHARPLITALGGPH